MIGKNCAPVVSMEYSCGGELHNQIGLGNDAIKGTHSIELLYLYLEITFEIGGVHNFINYDI